MLPGMGVSRYSRDPRLRRWQERFDELQRRCAAWHDNPTIGELTGHRIKIAQFECRAGGCGHHGKVMDLAKFGYRLTVWQLRDHYVCSKCGTKRPWLTLLWDGEGPA